MQTIDHGEDAVIWWVDTDEEEVIVRAYRLAHNIDLEQGDFLMMLDYKGLISLRDTLDAVIRYRAYAVETNKEDE